MHLAFQKVLILMSDKGKDDLITGKELGFATIENTADDKRTVGHPLN